MTQDKICDTVCHLASAGKRLPANLPNGVDPYESMCEAFCRVFEDTNVDTKVWDAAELNYIRGQAIFITPSQFEQEIKLVQNEIKLKTRPSYDTGGLSEEVWKRRGRTCSRLWKFTSRMLANKINIPEYLPTKEEAMQVGMKHGLSANELLIPTEKGGQLRSIMAFMAEYRADKAKNKHFPFRMEVKDGEVLWIKEA